MFFLPQELKSRRANVVQELQLLQNNCSVVLQLMNNEDIMKKMESMRDSKALNNFLTQEHNVSARFNFSVILIFEELI